MEIITIQPGQKSIRDPRPYPFHVNEQGDIQQQDFWHGKVAHVVGFQREERKQTLDVMWSEVWRKPELAVGLFVVTVDDKGQWATQVNAIETSTKRDVPAF